MGRGGVTLRDYTLRHPQACVGAPSPFARAAISLLPVPRGSC